MKWVMNWKWLFIAEFTPKTMPFATQWCNCSHSFLLNKFTGKFCVKFWTCSRSTRSVSSSLPWLSNAGFWYADPTHNFWSSEDRRSVSIWVSLYWLLCCPLPYSLNTCTRQTQQVCNYKYLSLYPEFIASDSFKITLDSNGRSEKIYMETAQFAQWKIFPLFWSKLLEAENRRKSKIGIKTEMKES